MSDTMVMVPLIPWLSALSLGGGLAWLAYRLMTMAYARRPATGSRYEDERRSAMRAGRRLYAWLEPLVDELAALLGDRSGWKESPLGQALAGMDEWRGWRPSEFLAMKSIEGVLVGLAITVLIAPTGYLTFAVMLGLALAGCYPTLAARSMIGRFARRLKVMRTRLPFVVDQIALMMQAGANFEDCLRGIAEDDVKHPLGLELARVLDQIHAGRTRREALEEFKQRIADRDVAELVFAITKGEELGTPLSAILTEQAEQMRIKRSQWGEKAAAEAEVQIVFPGMLVMIACLIVIITPILLPAAFNVFGTGD